MRGRFDTIRARILIGLALLLAGLIATAIAGAATLRQMRYAIEQELDALRTSTEVGSGLVTSVLEEIRAAEQYLGSPGDDPRREFQAAAEDAFQHQRRLDALGGLTVEDRLTVNRVKQLHAAIQTEYSIAHALRDLGRDREAVARAAAVRPQAAELTRLVRDLSRRQAQKAVKAAERLTADAADRERKLWVFVVALVLAGVFLSRYTVQSVHGPLGRLVTAAERFGAGDLRPVTTGEMPREFRVLADAIQQMGNRLRQIVGDVICESDRIAGAAGDLSAVSGSSRRPRARSRRPWWRSRAVRTSNAPPSPPWAPDWMRFAPPPTTWRTRRSARRSSARRSARWPTGTGATSLPPGACCSTCGRWCRLPRTRSASSAS